MSALASACPTCDAPVSLQDNTEVSEIINCGDCSTRLVVEAVTADGVALAEAPAIEEDWGE